MDTPKRGVTRCCADDVGACLFSLAALKNIHIIFRAADGIAGLKLKYKTCFIVPLLEAISDELIAQIRAWIVGHVPAWIEFQICAKLRYLGVWMGPSVSEESWAAPITRHHERCVLLATSRPPPT
eukprot:3828161-Pyramimonas_sp.AAC.1